MNVSCGTFTSIMMPVEGLALLEQKGLSVGIRVVAGVHP